MENNFSVPKLTMTMGSKLNEILIRRRRYISLPLVSSIDSISIAEASDESKSTVGAIIKNLESYGYNLSLDAVEYLVTTNDTTAIKIWYKECVEPAVSYITGDNHQYRIMYPNFPEQVMAACDIELFFNAFVHYATLGEWLPEYEAAERKVPIWRNEIKTTLIGCGVDTKYDIIFSIMSELMSASISWSTQDREDFEFLFTYCKVNGNVKLMDFMIETIGTKEVPNKENLCTIVSLTGYTVMLKTATDVLRYITYLSGGDVSLAENTRYKNIKRSDRVKLLKELDRMNPMSIIEDMWRYRERWIRIGERIHPFQYSERFPNVTKAFDSIRSGKKPLFFGGKVNNLINEVHSGHYQYLEELVDMLKKRPGEFARKLDCILRGLPVSFANDVVKEFASVASNISIPVLLQVANHFNIRNDIDDRVIMPKGMVAKAVVIENTLPRIRQNVCEMISIECFNAIEKQVMNRGSLGKVYLCPKDFEFMNAPFALRSASSGNKTVIRGSQIPVGEDTDVIRLFAWWTNKKSESKTPNIYDGSRVDIDLSMSIFDTNWKNAGHISYTHLRNAEIRCCHSGDITNGGEYGGKGVAEFIDIDIKSVAKAVTDQSSKFLNARYIAFNVFSYTGQTFDQFPCCFGWMKRDDVDASDGKTFDASTVDIRIDLNMRSKSCIPAVYDIWNKKIIWMDLAISVHNIAPINIESNSSRVAEAINAIVNLKKTTMLDVINANLCRATEVVNNRNEADIIFSLDTTLPTDEDGNIKEDVRIISPYDIDYFIGELM